MELKVSPLARKMVIEGLFAVFVLFAVVLLQKRMASRDAFAFWEAEMKANNKRLFGDAWKDV